MERENPRKQIIELSLGELGKSWPVEEAYTATLRRLKAVGELPTHEDNDFLRAVLIEILEQTSPKTYDFRLLPEFLKPKREQRAPSF